MTAALDDPRNDPAADGGCPACGAGLAPGQRYCFACGARARPLPAAVAALLGIAGAGGGGDLDATARVPERPRGGLAIPSPRSAAVAVMAILGFGVVVGAAAGPIAEGAPGPVVVAVSPPAAPAPLPAPAAGPAPAPAPSPVARQRTITQTVAAPPPPAAPAALPPPPAEQLPPIKHVFLIVLSGQGYDAAFGPGSQAPYLARTLTAKGELLANYYAVTQGELANAIALISGQGPNPDTAANCPTYSDVAPGTIDRDPANRGQVRGAGCVFPRAAISLPDELIAGGASWKAYVEDIGNGPPGTATTCRHPAPGASDDAAAPRPGDAYVTWRNPFVYFRSIVDDPGCAERVVGLARLAEDLRAPATAPSLSYIVPNRCHDGSSEACAPGQPPGMPSADAWLREVVPQIMASAAYKADGLIAITFGQAPSSGPGADTSACCTEPAYPNMPPGEPAPPASTTPSDEPSASTAPSDGAPAPASTTPSDGAPSSPAATGPAPPAGPLPPGADTATGGGGRVGLLLISRYVKPGSVNTVSAFNHFNLLRSIEDLFGLQPTGYAGYPGLAGFDHVVYNAPEKRSRAVVAPRRLSGGAG